MKRILPLILAFAMSLSARAQVQRMVCDETCRTEYQKEEQFQSAAVH